jgi:hypothetical protein
MVRESLELPLMYFMISGPQKKLKHSPVGRPFPHLPAQSELSSAFMVKNPFEGSRIWRGLKFYDYRSLNLNIMIKIEF